MGSATFLFVINFAIGLSFAAAFLALTWRSEIRLGRWCAAGFLAAATTVAVETFAFAIPSVRLVSALSFSALMLALTLIAAGLSRHYRPGAPITWLFGLFLAASLFNAFFTFDQPRGGWIQSFGYQAPFAIMLMIAAAIVLAASKRRAVDWAVMAVLAASAVQFLVKAALGALAGSGPGVRDYAVSDYAFYSQTAAGILSLLLGVSLTALVAAEVMAAAARRLQRDDLSGALNRAAFLEQAGAALRRSATGVRSSLIMCDLDHFKSINDRFGHAGGDEVIRGFGANLIELAGEGGLCGRVGGEEFCVLLPDCSIAAARIHVDAIRGLAAMTAYPLLPSDFRTTASFGIAVTDRSEPIEEAMRRADLALYEAKGAGRDTYRFAALALADAPSASAKSG